MEQKTVLALYVPDPTKDENENKLVKKEVTQSKVRHLDSREKCRWEEELTLNRGQGSIAFTSDQTGDHWVCVSLDSSDYALPDGAVMVRTLRCPSSSCGD